MAKQKLTVFQKLDKAISGDWGLNNSHNNTYDFSTSNGDGIIYKTDNKDDYLKTKKELQQNAYLNQRWMKANADLSVQAFAGLNNIKLMYRDADLMDSFPEIGSALDILSEEACVNNSNNKLLNIYSSSDRIKNVLEELFVNRLDIQVTAPMIIRCMCKYGNQFMMLNIDNKLGVTSWRQLPVYSVERLENGVVNPYGVANSSDMKEEDMKTKFVWLGENNSQVPFRNWQIAHFRLLTDSIYLPYGVSYLHKARRHWRMLSLMEDMMLIYRLERSIERRVYKIYVGAIDDADVQAYVQEIANNFKRTPIIDPMTGQVDLRKNLLPVRKDTPIPLLDGRTITIEELSKEYEDGKQNYVYSIQDKTLQICPGKVVWCGKNYTADKLVRITLDDGTYTVMAGEHEVVMRDGSKKRADNLSVGESVMPFFRSYDERCEKVYNPRTYKYETTHRMVAKFIACHIDCDKYDNNPQNLILRENQKIKNIDFIDGDDVYCMTVVGLNNEEDRHNFAIRSFNNDGSWCENGIFVSNCADQDIFIPVRDQNASTPIDTLAPAQNLTAMDDIKFVQNKLFTALGIPKTFLNYEESTGDGKNLALMDVRFTRRINRIQQAFLMEMTKVATIHLYLLGFHDELTNFSLSMNNPSTQAEQLEIETIQKKISVMRDAVADPGNGIPIMSATRALKEIMKWSDNEIKSNLEEIRLEKALAAELEKTTQIIKKTRLFDNVDRIYGEPGAEYQDQETTNEEGGGDMGGAPMGGGGSMDFGGDMPMDDGGVGAEVDSLGDVGADEGGDIQGAETEMPMENKNNKGSLLTENGKLNTNYFLNNQKHTSSAIFERVPILDKTLMINEEFDKMLKSLNEIKK
jgi:predicted nuclease of predicted toxin-antitoxin system